MSIFSKLRSAKIRAKMKAVLAVLACLGFETGQACAQVAWKSDDNTFETNAAIYNPMPENGATPDSLKVSCRISTFDAPEVSISVVSETLFKTATKEVPVTFSRSGTDSISLVMASIDGVYSPEYRWTTEDQTKIDKLDLILPSLSVGPLYVSNDGTGSKIVFDDSAQYGVTAGYANDVIHDCRQVSVDARTEAEGMTSVNDLEVLAGSASDECSDGTDTNNTQDDCDKARQYGIRLNELGICYGEQNQISADETWHPCGPNSNREDP